MPNNATAKTEVIDLNLGSEVKLYSHEVAAYVNDEFSVGNRLKFNLGLRGSFCACRSI